MFVYTIYRHPKDYPTKFVVRRWKVGAGQALPVPELTPLCLADTLNDARKSIPKNMVQMQLSSDDPVIVETWI